MHACALRAWRGAVFELGRRTPLTCGWALALSASPSLQPLESLNPLIQSPSINANRPLVLELLNKVRGMGGGGPAPHKAPCVRAVPPKRGRARHPSSDAAHRSSSAC